MRETIMIHLNTFADIAVIFAGTLSCHWVLGTPMSESAFWAVVAFAALLRTHRLERQARKGKRT